MDDIESSTGGRKSVDVRYKKKLSQTQQNVILGVAAVAGFCVIGKLLSALKEEETALEKDKDVETLESVLNEGNTRNLPLQAQVQQAKLTNLDNDEPDHEVVTWKRKPKRSKYADSFSEIVSDDDIAEEGEIFVNQDPVGRRGTSPSPSPKMRDAQHDLDSLKARKRRGKGKQLSAGEGVGLNIEGNSHFKAPRKGVNHQDEEAEDEDHEERPTNFSSKREIKEFARKESTNTSGSSEKLPSRQKKANQGRNSKAGGEEKTLKSHASTSANKEILVDESSRWESVNDYKVLKATSSKLPPSSSEMISNGTENHQMKEFQRERAETEKAQSMWDGRGLRARKRMSTTSEVSDQAYLQLKSSVSSSVSLAEETAEGLKVREVVKRSTLLPIPSSGDESEVHSSVYNVRETEKGLAVEEVVTRTKLMLMTPDSIEAEDFLCSDQSEPSRLKVWRILPLVLQIAAVLATLCCVLLILYSRERIRLPFSMRSEKTGQKSV